MASSGRGKRGVLSARRVYTPQGSTARPPSDERPASLTFPWQEARHFGQFHLSERTPPVASIAFSLPTVAMSHPLRSTGGFVDGRQGPRTAQSGLSRVSRSFRPHGSARGDGRKAVPDRDPRDRGHRDGLRREDDRFCRRLQRTVGFPASLLHDEIGLPGTRGNPRSAARPFRCGQALEKMMRYGLPFLRDDPKSGGPASRRHGARDCPIARHHLSPFVLGVPTSCRRRRDSSPVRAATVASSAEGKRAVSRPGRDCLYVRDHRAGTTRGEQPASRSCLLGE